MDLEEAILYTKKYLPRHIAYDKPVEQALIYFLKKQKDTGKEVTEMSIKTLIQKSFN